MLTQEGNPVTQELSYRFALNGASILFKVNRASDPKKNYKKMRSAYSTRSAIVHGGEDAERDNKLQPATSTIFRNCATFLNQISDALYFGCLPLLKKRGRTELGVVEKPCYGMVSNLLSVFLLCPPNDGTEN